VWFWPWPVSPALVAIPRGTHSRTLSSSCPGWDSRPLLGQRNHGFLSGSELRLRVVSRGSGCERCRPRSAGRARHRCPAALARCERGPCRGRGDGHPLPLTALLPSPGLKLERNGSIFYSFRGEGKLQNEDDLKE